jgi:SPASM domain peptide maturase of grasp-with-spasm system
LDVNQFNLEFFDEIDVVHLHSLNQYFKESPVQDIKFLLKYSSASLADVQDVIDKYARVSEVILYDAGCNEKIDYKGSFIYLVKSENLTSKSCGVICPSNFAINIPHYTEAQKFNTCLNKKISVDEFGNIKNCPSQFTSYGNIIDTKLVDVVRNEQFKLLWKIKKDDISICKSCEFRYICTDCRVFIEDSDNIYSKTIEMQL